MLHLYYGTDRQAVRQAAADFAEQNLPPDGSITTIDSQNFSPGQVTDALGAHSLFGGEEWFLLDTPSAQPDFFGEVKDTLKEMSESANTFLILEAALLAPAKKIYSKHAANTEEYSAQKPNRLNPFALADALAQKDRKQLWVLLQEMRLGGLPPEELIGIMWWQLKTLRLAELHNSAGAAGLKEFQYSKAKRALQKFSPGEVSTLSQSLLEVYHDGHAGIRDIDLAFEQWVLSGK